VAELSRTVLPGAVAVKKMKAGTGFIAKAQRDAKSGCLMFTIQNAVRVALVQVVVIVFGVLGAATSRRCWTAFDDFIPVPDSVVRAFHYGPMAMMLPVVWICLALTLRQRTEVSEDVKNLVFWAGLWLAAGLAIWFGAADVSPWLNVDFHMGEEQ